MDSTFLASVLDFGESGTAAINANVIFKEVIFLALFASKSVFADITSFLARGTCISVSVSLGRACVYASTRV
jgi:hypothetical protein